MLNIVCSWYNVVKLFGTENICKSNTENVFLYRELSAAERAGSFVALEQWCPLPVSSSAINKGGWCSGKHGSTTTLNCVVAHNFQTNSKKDD